jgi:hypothetical protein
MIAPLRVGLFLTQAVIFGLELGDHAFQFADALLAALAPGCLSFCVGLPHASYVTGTLRQDEGSFIHPGLPDLLGLFLLCRARRSRRKASLTIRAHRDAHSNTPRGQMRNRLRAITGAADGIKTELRKLIETLRADLHYRRWWWSR